MLYVYDATAGISTLNVVKSDDESVYNLQGARMPKSVQLAPGIYIRGGKKFVVR
jgi:putative extracellular ribonuclease